jgi:hypothetical protein
MPSYWHILVNHTEQRPMSLAANKEFTQWLVYELFPSLTYHNLTEIISDLWWITVLIYVPYQFPGEPKILS